MRGTWTKWLIAVMSIAIWGAVLTNVPVARAWVPADPPPTPTVPPPLPPPTPTTPPPTQPPPPTNPPPTCHNMPEPSTLVLGLIAGGTMGIGAIRRRWSK
jgi:hypothetical protein